MAAAGWAKLLPWKPSGAAVTRVALEEKMKVETKNMQDLEKCLAPGYFISPSRDNVHKMYRYRLSEFLFHKNETLNSTTP